MGFPGRDQPHLLRAAGTLTEVALYVAARDAALRTRPVNVAARFARPPCRPVPHVPSHFPRAHAWLAFWRTVFGT
jgi:hypothetical protein